MRNDFNTQCQGGTKSGKSIELKSLFAETQFADKKAAGGIPNDIQALRDGGYLSTSELKVKLNVPGLQTSWIINTLGVKPALFIRGGQAVYWAPDQIDEIRSAFIRHLAR